MFWALLVAIGVLLVAALAFDAVAKRRGTYRDSRYYRDASKQRRAQRINLLHTLYERRTDTHRSSRR